MNAKKFPQRQCIGCGEMKNKKEMIRILKTPEGEFVVDATGRKNGRGAYICPSMDCFKKTASGEFSTEKAVKSGKAHLVIVSEEASDNTKKMFTNMCTYYKVPILFLGGKEELGHSMGKQMRASLAVVDAGLAKAIVKQMNIIGGSEYESK